MDVRGVLVWTGCKGVLKGCVRVDCGCKGVLGWTVDVRVC